ncbi:MAG: NACHT domain-containing protein [Rubrivivax sp.]
MSDPSVDLALSVAKPLAAKVIDGLLKPAVALGRLVSDPLIDVFTNRFSEYLTRQYVKHSYLPTIVFQVRRPLEELYVPLTVSNESLVSKGKDVKRFKLDRYKADFLPALERVLLIDDAGMGKTTVSRYLLIQATKNLATVPVFVELRHLTSERTLFDVLLSELNPVGIDSSDLRVDKKQITRLLDKGLFTFFLDGYDEIVAKSREAVTIDIKGFIDAYGQNKFLITSRPEHALASFPSFKVFKIEPLEVEEAFNLIRKYDNNGDRAARLIDRLRDKSLQGVHEFLRNPLLTTLLYRAYDYKNQIPLKKPVFYRQVFDALYEWHDLTKDGYSTRPKGSGLDIDGFHKILRGLGFVSVLRGRVEADTDEMLAWIREARTYAPELRFSESAFLEDAIKAVPVLRREGNAVLWAHKSLAEYFAAQFIVIDSKSDQRRICQHIVGRWELRSYYNLLDLLYDMDVAVFGQNFIIPLVDFLKLEIKRVRERLPKIAPQNVERRVAATIATKLAVYNNIENPHPFRNQLGKHARQIAADWELLPPESKIDEALVFPPALSIELYRPEYIGGRSGSKEVVRAIVFAHPLRTIMDVLIEKKHPLVMLRAFYPESISKSRIVGLRSQSQKVIDDLPESLWNSEKNFVSTTGALMKLMPGVINLDRLDAVVREIEQSAQQSKTTTLLLASFGDS